MTYPGIVWITGASSGIGRALALLYAQNGSTVYASARTASALEVLVEDATQYRGKIIATPMDVTKEDDITSAIHQFKQDNQIPELCILNAGFYEVIAFEDLSLNHFNKTMDVNYTGVVSCLLSVLPLLKKEGKGKVAVVSSVAGYSGLPNAPAYGASKAALINLCESLKHDFDNAGLALTIVNPGFVKTPMTDKNSFTMPFLLTPVKAAERIERGLRDDRFEVTFPRRLAWLLKLLRVIPYPIYFWLTRKLTQ